MQWLAQVAVRRPVFASVLMLIVLVLGIAGYVALGVDEYPNVDLPVVVVAAHFAGSSPRDIESDLTDKIEGAVNTISGLDVLQSRSTEGMAQIIATFDLGKSGDVAAQEVRDKLQLILPDLPRGVDPPLVTKLDPGAAPVVLLAVRSTQPIRETTELADTIIRRQLETIAGVGQVSLIGGRKRQLHVWLDPVALRGRGITAVEVLGALGAQNLTMPGGSLDAGPSSTTVRVEGRVGSVEELGRIVVRGGLGGEPIRVEDVARVEDGEEDSISYAALDGDRTVVLSIRKQSGTNTIEVVDAVKARLDDTRTALPSGVRVELIRDNSAVIRTGTHAVTEHLIVGALLAALVVLLFLGDLRSTLISALAIPISVIGTFGMMKLAGFTLNSLTLLALALSVGIVIDDAIVVLENVMRWMQGKKAKPFVATVLATREIGMAVLATTLSLIAVFVPVALMGGMVGRFLGSFGLTMAFAIAVSLFVSFTLTPALTSRFLRVHQTGGLGRIVEVAYRPVERTYLVALEWSMKHRWAIVLLSAAALLSIGPIGKRLPSGFTPTEDRAEFQVDVRAPEGTTLDETRLIAERVARDAKRLPGVTRTLLTVGEDPQHTANLGNVRVFLSDPLERSASQQAVMAAMRREIFPSYPNNVRLRVSEIQSIGTGNSMGNITYALSGNDLDLLAEKAERIASKMRQVPGAVDVDTSLVLGKPELGVFVDRERAADLGVRVSDVADTLRLFVAGLKAGDFEDGQERYDVQVRAGAEWRVDEDTLATVDVPSSKQGAVPLASVSAFKGGTGPAVVDRLGRRREVTLSANAAPGYGENVIGDAIQRIVAEEGLPEGGRLEPIGRTKEQGRAQGGFVMVFLLAFIFMYLVLAAQFESWVHPLTILITLPLTVPFALVSLLIFGQSLNLFSGLGLLVLFGIVKKNAILQIDQTNQLRAGGMPRFEAILEANRQRLRPILMTTFAFVAGMVPLLLSKGIGAEKSQAMAGIVLGGQTLSLALTLLAAPVVYSLLDDAARGLARLGHASTDGPADRGERELDELLGKESVPKPAE